MRRGEEGEDGGGVRIGQRGEGKGEGNGITWEVMKELYHLFIVVMLVISQILCEYVRCNATSCHKHANVSSTFLPLRLSIISQIIPKNDEKKIVPN
jgi:hypothetical protein